ncbi:ribonuclease H family protein [Tabrizicola sp.]|uniref:ribonuclease H family protein n=1 Tax=Tabrizicola sp. TaxID=2005166 RepID=UPI002FDCE946
MTHQTIPTTTHDNLFLASTSGAQPSEGQTRISIYSDGSSIGNPGYGGYGVVILRLDASGEEIKRREIFGSADDITTNIRMEMTAVCVALEALGIVTDEQITFHCDANLIPNAMNSWLPNWKARGWRKGDGKPVENADLWQRLERAAEGRNITWAWVRGHNGSAHNERADRLAYRAARKAETKAAGAR